MKVKLLVAAIVVASALIGLRAIRSDERLLNETGERGQLVIDALEAFVGDSGSYPERLVDLVPVYLDSILPPVWGTRQWRYRVINVRGAEAEDLGYELSVGANDDLNPLLYYRSHTARWNLED